MQFTLVYRSNCFDLYLFVEGWLDLSFYLHFVRQYWAGRGQVHGFNCRGKDNVIEMIPRVRPTLDHVWRALFFIDKDVDDFCGCAPAPDQYLYQTECYAIENFIVSPASISIIWTDLIGMPATDQTLTKVLTHFDRVQGDFCRAMREVMGWVIHLRREGHKVVLNDVSIQKVVKLDKECVASLESGWQDHIIAASNTKVSASSINAGAVRMVIGEISTRDPKTFIRGKFEIWFFAEFVRRMVTPLTEKIAGQPRQSIRVTIKADNAIDILAPRLQPPATLLSFLTRTLPAAPPV